MSTPRLTSYVRGEWVQGSGGFRPLIDPTTEEVLAEASTEGVDMASVVAFAKSEGLAALQKMTFRERGDMLAQAAKALHAERDALLDLSTVSGGNTRGDAKFDVDGAISTLSYYAKLGEELGDSKWFVEGELEQLARSPRYTGHHLLSARQGVAVHINAYNFPAWGMAEKGAVALLAGMPVITKPATSTAILTHRMVELVVQAGVLPKGVLQCLVGSAGDLLSHLGAQDVVAFTGSSWTAQTLRQEACVIERSTRLNVEADSLNAAVLGRDVDPDSETFDLFVKDVARDMTQKAGQKCTAIRRVFVPKDKVDAAREALIEELARTKTGDPKLKGVRMGPVATKSQLADVMEGLEKLKSAAKVVTGGERGQLEGVDGDKGYFLQPTLLQAEDGAQPGPAHDLEVFGPVATLLPYSGDPEEAGCLVGMGQGGLVASVYTDKLDVAKAATESMAPWNGRLNIGSAKVAEHSLGPGAVLPQLLHGGPGRAGGGEELGGRRGLALYLQRTALQGYKPLLEKMLADAPSFPV